MPRENNAVLFVTYHLKCAGQLDNDARQAEPCLPIQGKINGFIYGLRYWESLIDSRPRKC